MRAVAMILLMAASIPALAEPTRDEVMSGAERCYGIADNHAWLDCFYGSAQPMRTLLGLSPAAPAQVRLVPPPGANYSGASAPRMASRAAPSSDERTGLFSGFLGTAKPVVTDMPMASYDLSDPSAFIITLSDGQRWAQNEGSGGAPHWRKPAATYLVSIVAGALNSYNLHIKGEDTMYKVHKVR